MIKAISREKTLAIKITSDRMIDLSNEELKELNISTMSCFVNLAGKSYSDLEDIFPEDVFTYFEEHNELAKTAAKSPELYYAFFEPFIKNGDSIIHFAASSGISSICENAKIAGKQLGNVFVVDTLTLSNGIALLAKYAIELIRQGEKDTKKVYELCLAKRDKIRGSFIIETLDCLYKGGRCSSMQLFGANLLKIRPVIAMNEKGQMQIREKYRGKYLSAVARYIAHTFEKFPNPDLSQLYLLHSCKNDTMNDFLLEEIAKYHKFDKINFNACSCNCAIHSGRGAMGMFFCEK